MNVVDISAESGEDFETFWKHYPRKVGKALAKARWNAIIEGGTTRTLDRDSGQYVALELKATAEEMLAGLKAWKAANTNFQGDFLIEEKYIPHASTWLNRGMWMDFES